MERTEELLRACLEAINSTPNIYLKHQKSKFSSTYRLAFAIDVHLANKKPDPEKKIRWEERVILTLELLGDMNTSDAQALIEAHEVDVFHCWLSGKNADHSAKFILQKTKL
jgi:hypothetical protein